MKSDCFPLGKKNCKSVNSSPVSISVLPDISSSPPAQPKLILELPTSFIKLITSTETVNIYLSSESPVTLILSA